MKTKLDDLKPRPPEVIIPNLGKPKWVKSVEQKENVTINVHWFDRFRYDLDKKFRDILLKLLISYLTNKMKESKMFDWLSGAKTYILVVLGVLVVLVQFLTGDMSFIEFLNSQAMVELLALLGIGALRAGVSKNGK